MIIGLLPVFFLTVGAFQAPTTIDEYCPRLMEEIALLEKEKTNPSIRDAADAINKALAEQSFEKGKTSFLKERYEEAIVEFRNSLYKQPNNFDLNLYMSKAYFELQEYEEALFAIRRAIILDEENPRARFQAGLTYLALNNTEAALREFDFVINKDTSPELEAEIQRYLSIFKEESKGGWSSNFFGYFLIQAGLTTNGTYGSHKYAPLPGDTIFVIPPTKASDKIFSGLAYLEHDLGLPIHNFSISNSFFLYWADQETFDFNDLVYFQYSFELNYDGEKHFGSLGFQYLPLYNDSELSEQSRTEVIRYGYFVSPNFSIKTKGSFSHTHHFFSPSSPLNSQDGKEYSGSISFNFAIGTQNFLIFEYSREYKKSPTYGEDFDHYNRDGGSCAFYRTVCPELTLNLYGSVRKSRYQNIDPLYFTKRTDYNLYALIGATYDIFKHTQVSFDVSWEENLSNLILNDYQVFSSSFGIKVNI